MFSIRLVVAVDIDDCRTSMSNEIASNTSNASNSQQERTTTIKTIDLFPGSTTLVNRDSKPPISPLSTLTNINARSLLAPIDPHGNDSS
jgi:hypothetical protein